MLEGPTSDKGCGIRYHPLDQKVCRGGPFFNNGTIDRGASIEVKPTTIGGGSVAGIEPSDVAPNRADTGESSSNDETGASRTVRIGRVTTNGVGEKAQVSSRFPATSLATGPQFLERFGCARIR